MTLFTVSTPFNIDIEFALAPFYKRVLAWVADLFLLFLYCYIMLFFVYDTLLGGIEVRYKQADNMGFTLGLFTIVIPAMLYHLLFEVFMNGRSPGKILMGIKVMNKEGASATLSQLLLRWILFLPNYFLVMIIGMASPIYFLAVAIVLGFAALPDIITMLISARSQRLGDLAAGTVVVDTRYKMDIQDTIYMKLEEEDYIPRYPEVLQLSDRDINTIKNMVSRKLNKDAENYIYRVAYKVEEVLGIKMESSPLDFLLQLLKDYNYMTRHKVMGDR